MRKAFACCRHDMRRLLYTPRAWAVLILTGLFLDTMVAPIRLLLIDTGMTISWFGLLLYVLNDAQATALTGLGLLLLLFDAPFTDEAQRYIITRAGRGAWGRGQVAYVLLTTLLYLFFFSLLLLALLSPWLDWSGGWSDGLNAFVRDGLYETYDSMLEYDPWLMDAYTPISGVCLLLSSHFLIYAALALILFAVNALGGGRLGFLIAGAPLLLDSVMEEFFDTPAYYYSPVSLARLSMLDYGDGLGRPPLWYGLTVLIALAGLMIALCVRLSKKKEIGL